MGGNLNFDIFLPSLQCLNQLKYVQIDSHTLTYETKKNENKNVHGWEGDWDAFPCPSFSYSYPINYTINFVITAENLWGLSLSGGIIPV